MWIFDYTQSETNDGVGTKQNRGKDPKAARVMIWIEKQVILDYAVAATWVRKAVNISSID